MKCEGMSPREFEEMREASLTLSRVTATPPGIDDIDQGPPRAPLRHFLKRTTSAPRVRADVVCCAQTAA